MLLSMAILEHWISQYHPVSIIHSTEPTISGIRLFSYEKVPNADYLYVGRNRDFFENSQSEEVLLVHRKDVISLNTQELEDVFDNLMDAFVFYQNWEQKMLSAYLNENPEQGIIDACKDIFGPMFFATMSLQVTAFSRQYPRGSINRNWDDFWEIGTLSINSLNRMQKGQYLEKMSHAWDCEVFCERYAENYPYSMMISQENAAHKLTGQLTVISRTPFEEYHRHLAIFLKRALCLVAGREGGAEQSSVAQSLFEDFLLGKHTDAASFHTFYQMQGWKPENYCMIVLLGKENMAIAACTYHVKALRKAFQTRFSVQVTDSRASPTGKSSAACLWKTERNRLWTTRFRRKYRRDFLNLPKEPDWIISAVIPSQEWSIWRDSMSRRKPAGTGERSFIMPAL